MKSCWLRAAVLVAWAACACSDDGGASGDAHPDGLSDGPAGDRPAGDGPAGDAANPDAGTVAALPVIAWDDTESGHNEVLLRRWNGTSWEALGGSGSGSGVSGTSAPSAGGRIAFDARGNPVVAWSELVNGRNAIYLKRWDGAAWQEVAGSASGAGVSADGTALALDVDGSGRITVAGVDASCGIRLRQFDGTAWQDLGGTALGLCDWVVILFDGSRHPVVAWRGTAGAMLVRFDGSSWQELGGSGSTGVSNGPNGVGQLALALGSGDQPVVAWQGESIDIYLKRWNGSTWEELDGSAASGGVSRSGVAEAPAVAVDGQNRPAVAWWDNGGVGHVKRWNGLRWEELGGITPNPGGGYEPAILALPGDALLLAWEEQREIYARVWTGYTWEEMGTSARGLGISNTLNGLSYLPVVAGTQTPTLPEPPPGDGCNPPSLLAFSNGGAGGTATASGNTSGAADDFRGSCIAQTSGGDVVYAFTTTVPLTLAARVSATSTTFQPALYLRAASCRAFSDVACNVATGSGGTARLLVRGLAPGTYLLFVDGEALSSGPFTLDAALTPYPPPGETCSNAIPLAFSGGGNGPGSATAMGDNTLYGNDISSNCGGLGADVFYSFTTTTPLDFASSLNATFTGGSTGLIDAATGTPVQLCFVNQHTLPAGSYCLIVDADNASQRGGYTVTATLSTPTPGDSCVNPIPLVFTGGSASVSGTTAARNDSFGSCIGNTNGGDIVYSFTTTTTLHFTATLTPGGINYYPALYLQRGGCGVGSIACSYCSLSCASTTLDIPSLAPNTYYLWVDGIDGTGGSYTLNATLQ